MIRQMAQCSESALAGLVNHPLGFWPLRRRHFSLTEVRTSMQAYFEVRTSNLAILEFLEEMWQS